MTREWERKIRNLNERVLLALKHATATGNFKPLYEAVATLTAAMNDAVK